MTSSFLAARRPDLPPADGLQSPTAELLPDPSGPKFILVALIVFGVVDVALILGQANPDLVIPTVGVTVLALYLFLVTRRTYTAVGPDWIYVRTQAFGSGKWMRFADIQTIKLGRGRGGIPLLRIKSQKGLPFSFSLADPDLKTPLRQSIAQQALASTAEISPEAAKYLYDWLT